jgi:uncharacterized repeat protein (TIGR01451 family)
MKISLKGSWVALSLAFSVLVLAPPARAAVGDMTEFSVPNEPRGIAAGPDGNLWFTEFGGGGIDRITTSGSVTAFPTPPGLPQMITSGPDGNLWFADSTGNQIGRITPSGVVTEFIVPTPGSYPGGITTGPDGNLWFTETGASKIGRVTPSGTFSEFPTGDNPAFGIATGPDGNLWYSEYTNAVGQMTTSGAVTEFPISSGASADMITAGPDGDLWFTEFCCNNIARMTTSGAITEFPTTGSGPAGIAVGPDGNLWFAEIQGNKVGRITPSGMVTEFAVPTPGAGPSFITAGSDGNMWFTEPHVSRIGRVSVTTGADLSVSQTVSPDPVVAGANLVYQVTVRNAGPDADPDVTLTDQLPHEASFVSATTSQGLCDGVGSVTCTLGVLGNGGTATVTLVVTTRAAGTITNDAEAAGSVSDPDLTNNTSEATTTVAPAGADLSVTNTDFPDPIIEGGTLTYTIVVANKGPGGATDVSMEDGLPGAAAFEAVTAPLSWSCTAPAVGSSGAVACTKGYMAPGESTTFTLSVKAGSGATAASTLVNTATVGSATTDPNPSNNSAPATTGLEAVGADLSVQKSASPHPVRAGRHLTYTIVVRDHGPEVAQGVVMTDRLPARTKFLSIHAPRWACMTPAVGHRGRIRCTKGSLGERVASTIVVVVRVGSHAPAGDLITNTATVHSQFADPKAVNNSDAATTRIRHPV